MLVNRARRGAIRQSDAATMGNETLVRFGIFVSVLVAMMIWEGAAPRRPQFIGRAKRWPANLGVVIVSSLLVRLLFPTAAVGVALLAEQRGWGLLHIAAMPTWLAGIAGFLILDLAIYLQHVLFHAVPVLWRLHRMHHADLEFDCTTGVRFHPVEVLLSMGIKMMVIAAVGAPAVAVLVFEIVLNATSVFNHGNVRAPMDGPLRWLVVTPDMHRTHHSIRPEETNSNFGFNLPWWDRLFGTYLAQPKAGHKDMVIGIEQFREVGELRLDRMLVQPLRGRSGNYPINRPSVPQ